MSCPASSSWILFAGSSCGGGDGCPSFFSSRFFFFFPVAVFSLPIPPQHVDEGR